MTQTDIETTKDAPMATVKASPLAVLESALQSGRNADELGKLHEIYRQGKADEAKAEYDTAFAEFQAECPAVTKGREADFVPKGGARVHYWSSPLDDIDAVVLPFLNKHGFTRTFGNATLDEAGRILTVSCILSHKGGHHEERAFSVPTETSAGMSPQQKFGNADTYAKRRAFINVAGLKGCEVDNDAGDDEPAEAISEEQARHLNDKLIEAEADKKRFLKWAGVGSLGEITTDKYEACVREIQRKIDANRRDGT